MTEMSNSLKIGVYEIQCGEMAINSFIKGMIFVEFQA